jgi:hypothetical protein
MPSDAKPSLILLFKVFSHLSKVPQRFGEML